MKKSIFSVGLFACLLLFHQPILAVSASTPVSPTKASEPLPTLKETHNIDVVLGEKVQSVISKLPILKNQAVSASSNNRIITLEGSVENKEQEKAAIKAANSVKGVKGVKSQLTIKLIGSKQQH